MALREQDSHRLALRPTLRSQRGKEAISATSVSVGDDKAGATVCAPCRAAFEATVQVIDAYNALLSSAKAQFIDDILHHHQDNDGWLRLLRALGAEERDYYCRLATDEAV